MSICKVEGHLGPLADMEMKNQEVLVESLVNDFMGLPEYIRAKLEDRGPIEAKAYLAWKDARANLIALLSENYRISASAGKNPQDYIDSLRDYLQQETGVFGTDTTIWKGVEPRRILLVSKTLNRLVNLQKSRWGKKLNIWERAFLPVSVFASRIDRFGTITRFITRLTTMTENSRRSSARWKAQYTDITSKYSQSLDTALANIDLITKDYVLDGLSNMTTSSGDTVTFLGSRLVGDQVVHDVVDEDTGEKKVLDGKEIPRSKLESAIKTKYVSEFANDVLHGQARLINWVDEATDEERTEIMGIISEIKKLNELSQYEGNNEEKAELARMAKESLRSGHRKVYETNHNNMKFKYVMIKRSENSVLHPDSYRAFIISHETIGDPSSRVNYFSEKYSQKSRRYSVKDKQLAGHFSDGFYKANEWTPSGSVLLGADGNYSIAQDTPMKYDFSNLNSRRYKNQPPSILLNTKARVSDIKEPRMQADSFFSMIFKLRAMYRDIGKDLQSQVRKENDRVKEAFTKYANALNADKIKKILNSKNEQAELAKIYKDAKKEMETLFGIHNNVFVTKEGDVIVPNEHFELKTENYAPVVYTPERVINMLEAAIDRLGTKIAEQETKEMAEGFERSRDELELIFARMVDDAQREQELSEKMKESNDRGDSKIILASKNVHTKHRKRWTNPALRRKDGNVHAEYLDKAFYNIEKNKVMADMLEIMTDIIQSNESNVGKKDLMGWVVNRARISFRDPDAKASVGNVDFSYEKVARILNTVSLGRKWDAKSAQTMIRFSRSFFNALLLGHTGAMVNRTQVVNTFINYGWDLVKKSGDILDGNDPYNPTPVWEAIIDNLGIDEVTNMFMDVMASGGDLDLSDAGMLDVPFVPFQIPRMPLADFLSFLRKSSLTEKEGTAEAGMVARIKEINDNKDLNLRRSIAAKEELIKSNPKLAGKYRRQVRALNTELARLKNMNEKERVLETKSAMLDLMMTPKSAMNRRNLEFKFRKVLGDVADERMRRMVAWKMSWWPSGALGKEIFTFTEGERKMRRQAAIAALLSAASAGQLGTWNPKGGMNQGEQISHTYTNKDGLPQTVTVPAAFFSDAAVRIARGAVKNTMFGMSQGHLGEAMAGFGGQVFLYKSYPIQQILHDWKVTKQFMDSSRSKTEAVERLGKAFWYSVNKAMNSEFKGQSAVYDDSAHGVDHEAMKALRFIGSRVSMSILAVAIENFSLLARLFNAPAARQINSMFRGGENPLLAVAFRIGLNAILYSMVDEDEIDFENVTWDVMRLLFPVFFTLPLNIIFNWLED